MSERKTPKALYGCNHEDCAVEVSYPPDMLHWSEKMHGWYCENCFDHLEELIDEAPGVSLADFLYARTRMAEKDRAELVEAAYREGHSSGRTGASMFDEDDDWRKSETRAILLGMQKGGERQGPQP